ncbi:MAG: hypothetical protein JSW61_07265 [Candidatus Thorarchaeota archaeon]|nr:MAG: hypothetical protein JSW61_07265 [Candidatus Thorarchaeota archaeon]
MREKYGRFLIALTVIALLTCMPCSHTPEIRSQTVCERALLLHVPSDIAWSDDFDDEDISDWHIDGINWTADPGYYIPGNFTATGGVLRATGPECNFAGHNSSVAFGTWIFDVDIQDPVNEYHFYISIISATFNEREIEERRGSPGYAIGFYTPDDGQHEIRILRGSHDLTPHGLFMDYYYDDDIIGWKNIIVTRETSGQFYVYLDGVLILEGVNLDYTTSERFVLWSHGGPAIDNVSVSNTIDYDAAPPKWDHPLHGKTINFGDSFYYDLNATDYSGIDQWWIDDLENFTIDDDGIITNIRELAVGDYDVTVWVNDTLGNTQTGAFALTVEEGPEGIPIELVALAIGLPGVVVVALVLWRVKKR